MQTLVQFGAGNIGRGFIAPTFTAAGWAVVFVDIDRARIAALNQRQAYLVREVAAREVRVAPVSGIVGDDLDAVAGALARCDLAATAVGLGALRHLGRPLAEGLRRRDRPLDVLVCENGATASEQLRAAVLAHAGADERARLDAALGCVRTSIGRMIPPTAPGGDLLDIDVEPYAHLPVERAAFRGPVPDVPHLDARADFDLVLRQKLYLHNLTHACLAYAGQPRGYVTIPDCMADAALVDGARAAGAEAVEALARAHGRDDRARAAIRAECFALLDDLIARYRNRALGDPVARVARDPLRKLAGDDRLVGAARLCLAQRVAPNAIARHIVLATRYRAAADEPDAARWNDLRRAGPIDVLRAAANLTDTEPLMKTIATANHRLAAAQAMQRAGIILRQDEIDALEIADFGLGRFPEFGLAIHVYVNTDRCCAKELVMTPGQICPEHRHPPIDGDPGKEETFRVRQGEVRLYLPGHKKDSGEREAALKFVPADKQGTVTMFRCVHLKPGDQYTLKPNTPHWFVAGADGAVVSEFSTKSRDEADVFTDPAIKRLPDAA
ncbi:MAG TPA: D-lyxose/D-mannose family sugar isomerase [Planctomycetota bacterium]|nr:D-lyxose/D-mannose family sugar isomerase [Planctomycetota bacterium]